MGSSESAESGNLVGHLLSGPRASLRASLQAAQGELERLRLGEATRSSQGRWRPLFPTLTASQLLSPTVSRSTASMGVDGLRRSRELKSRGLRVECRQF